MTGFTWHCWKNAHLKTNKLPLMDLMSVLKDYARYNVWANERVIQWLKSKPANLLEQETPSSFPTLRATVLHIWAAQDAWLQRLRGIPSGPFLANTFSGTTDDLFTGFAKQTREFDVFLEQCPDDFFQQSIAYKNSLGQPFQNANAEVILHCLQHSTYHRGQLVTMGRSLGLTDPPQLDYIAYVRIRDDAQKTPPG